MNYIYFALFQQGGALVTLPGLTRIHQLCRYLDSRGRQSLNFPFRYFERIGRSHCLFTYLVLIGSQEQARINKFQLSDSLTFTRPFS